MSKTDNRLLANRGELITCPRCGDNIATLTRNIYVGEIIDQNMFAGIQYQIENGMKCDCMKCGAPWSGRLSGDDAFTIHFKRGWA